LYTRGYDQTQIPGKGLHPKHRMFPNMVHKPHIPGMTILAHKSKG
jgi:hypothetical protein